MTRTGAKAFLLAAISAVVLAPAAAAHHSDGHNGGSGSPDAAGRPGGDPRGSNGTIKIDGAPSENSHGNEPNPGCAFDVVFWNFDDGQRADITVRAQPPTGAATVATRMNVLVSDDPAGGGRDLDARVRFGPADLNLSGLEQHPRQGYHLKVTADAIGAPGGAKQKVLWLRCPGPSPAPATSARAAARPVADSTTSVRTTASQATGATVSSGTTAVAGRRIIRNGPVPNLSGRSGAPAGVLAYTGLPAFVLIELAWGLIGLGVLAVLFTFGRETG